MSTALVKRGYRKADEITATIREDLRSIPQYRVQKVQRVGPMTGIALLLDTIPLHVRVTVRCWLVTLLMPTGRPNFLKFVGLLSRVMALTATEDRDE